MTKRNEKENGGQCESCKCFDMGYFDGLDGQFRQKLWDSLTDYRLGWERGKAVREGGKEIQDEQT